MSLPIGLQLWSINGEFTKDYRGTLKKLAAMGYDGVEFAGFAGAMAEEMKTALDEAGLKGISAHVGKDILSDDAKLADLFEYAKIVGIKYIVCPYDRFENAEGLQAAIELYNAVAKKCADQGFVFAYHNHAHEFVMIDGVPALDKLYAGTDAALVNAEFDVYWVQYAGSNPVEYLKCYAGRIPVVHLKDMAAGEEKKGTEVGCGIIDMKAVIDAAKAGGTEWLFVEQEQFNLEPMEAVKVGVENMKKLV